MLNYNGAYLLLDPLFPHKMILCHYDGGNDTKAWLSFCHDLVAPSSRLIDVVSVRNPIFPLAFLDVDIIVDDEGLLRPPVVYNPRSSVLADQHLFGAALLGYRALDEDGEGYHVYPLSESPHFVFIKKTLVSLSDGFGDIVDENENASEVLSKLRHSLEKEIEAD